MTDRVQLVLGLVDKLTVRARRALSSTQSLEHALSRVQVAKSTDGAFPRSSAG